MTTPCMHRPLQWLSTVVFSTLLAACGGGDQGRAPILGLPAATLTSVAVTPATASVPAGTAQQFTATATYSDGASRIVPATWSSGTPAVATVGATTGLATGVSPGSAVITGSFGGMSGSATLTVTPAALTSITVTPANPSIAAGLTQQFTATGSFTDGTSRNITSSSVFTSATTARATITSGGLATGVSAGTSVITATSAGMTGTTTLTVTPAVVATLALTPTTIAMQVGTTRQLAASATYTDNTVVNVTASAAYTSSTPAAATVGASSGLVTGVAAGSTVITAAFGGKTTTTAVTVTAPAVTAIVVTPATGSVAVGASLPFTAIAQFADGTFADVTNTANWTSGTTAVATILPGGLARAILVGSATITASFGGASASATMNVTATP